MISINHEIKFWILVSLLSLLLWTLYWTVWAIPLLGLGASIARKK